LAMGVPPWWWQRRSPLGDFVDVACSVRFGYMCASFLLCKHGQVLQWFLNIPNIEISCYNVTYVFLKCWMS
jgi:hypothetical protein